MSMDWRSLDRAALIIEIRSGARDADLVDIAKADTRKTVLAAVRDRGVPQAPARKLATPREQLDWYEERLTYLLETSADAYAAGSFQAIATIEIRIMKAKEKIEEMEALLLVGVDSLSEDELLAEMQSAAMDMPEAHLLIFASEYERRHGQRLRLVKG